MFKYNCIFNANNIHIVFIALILEPLASFKKKKRNSTKINIFTKIDCFIPEYLLLFDP